MDNSTPPKASTESNPSLPFTQSWLTLTPENGSTSRHREERADTSTKTEGLGTGYGGRSHANSVASTFMIYRLYDADNEDNGGNPFEPAHSGCPSSTSSPSPSSSSSNNGDIPPNNSSCKDIGLVDATIRPVTPANAPVSVDTLCFSRKPALPRRCTSMTSYSSSLRHVGPGPGSSTEPLLPPLRNPSNGDCKLLRNGEDLPDTLREHTASLESEHSFQGATEDLDEGSPSKKSFKSRLRQLFKTKSRKGFGLAKRFRKLWEEGLLV